jgi:hypothetical protein
LRLSHSSWSQSYKQIERHIQAVSQRLDEKIIVNEKRA